MRTTTHRRRPRPVRTCTMLQESVKPLPVSVEDICTFISSLDSGTYDQTGDIVIGEGGVKTISGKSYTATGAQSLFLTVLVLSTMGLAGYAAMLHEEISGEKSDGRSGKECLGTYGLASYT